MSALAPELESTYDVLQTMGGGMGAVYKVRHRLFGEIRVIKVMQALLADNPEVRERFSAEAKRGKQLKHKNIAEVLDFQIGSNGNPYLVMEYVDGVNLRDDFARRGRPYDPATVVDIGVQTLSALGYIHDKNLIHRDISPDNLMITRDSDGSRLIKLIDLGIAKSLEDTAILTRAGDFIGKISYASPEQFGGVVDARSDFYSLGVVLYELLTAAKPITATNTAAYIMAHHQTPPRPFSETDPEGRVPDALRRVVLKALEKKPEERYQTAAEFSAALQNALPALNAKPATITAPATTIFTPPTVPSSSAPAELTEIVPPQTNRGTQTLLLFVAGIILLAGIAFVGVKLFESTTKPQTAAVIPTPAPTLAAAASQPAGVSVAIEAPKPQVSAAPPVVEQPQTMTTPPIEPAVVVDEAPKVIAKPAAPPVAEAAKPIAQPAPPLRRGPDLAEGDRARKQALAFSTAHDWSNAVTAWRQFIHDYSGLNPAADHAAWYNLGVAYESLSQWHEAADAFESATLADSNINDISNLLHLGRCYGKLGRWTDAVSAYKRATAIDPANEIARRSLVYAQQQGQRAQ
jgi:serine/threonine-protein kinase